MTRHLSLLVLAGILISAFLAGCAQGQVEIDPGKRETDNPSESIETEAIEGATPSNSKAPNIVTPEIADEPVWPGEVKITPETSSTLLPEDTLERKLVILASEDLADKLDISVSQVELASIEAVKWPDASLGCPQPNMMYAQVITPGYRVILRVGGDVYNYHTNMEGRMILCDLSSPSFLRLTPWLRSEDRK